MKELSVNRLAFGQQRASRPARRSTLCTLAVSLVLFCAPAAADYIDPGDVKVELEPYEIAHTDFSHGLYEYEVSWQGIPVGDANVVVGNKGDKEASGEDGFFHVVARARTGSFIDFFYKLRFISESIFDAQSLQPTAFYSRQKENSREKFRKVSFGKDGSIKAVYVKNGKERSRTSFSSQSPTLDPISAAFVARSLPIDLGSEHSFDVFNGKHRYLITFKVEARERIGVGDTQVDSFRVVPSVQKLTDTEGEDRLESATIWISADEKREVLKLESKVLVGHVSAELKRFVPAEPPQRPTSVEMARAAAPRGEKKAQH